MGALSEKVAIVTGASSGIGWATATLFAREGAAVVVSGRNRAKLDELVTEITAAGGRAVALAGDVRDESVACGLVTLATQRFGGLDVAFNNAGATGAAGPTHELSPDDWRETIETNLTSAFLGVRHQLPVMLERGGGSIIFTSSFVGYTVGFPGLSAYAAAKAGLVGLAQVIAAEYGARGVRANAILPGGTDTPSNHANAPGATPETRAFVEGLHAVKRMAAPMEIARAVLHLASDDSSFITGTALLVDGGVSIART